MRDVRSRYVVTVKDTGRLKDGRFFLVMEWIDGDTLEKRINRRKPEEKSDLERFVASTAWSMWEPRAITWMHQCARGMHEVHEEGIIHRDLKPANLFIDQKSSDLKIGDFGLARKTEPLQAHSAWTGRHLDLKPDNPMKIIGWDSSKGDSRPDQESLQSQPVDYIVNLGSDSIASTAGNAGTPYYMAPEHWDGNPGKRSDIYSFGATFYEVVTGQPLFTAHDTHELRQMHKFDPPQEPISLNPGLSKEINSLIMRCLEKDPARRFGSFWEIIRELGDLPELMERINRGHDHLKSGQYRRARQIFSKLTGFSPNCAEAWCGLGDAYRMQAEEAGEREDFEIVDEYLRDSVEAYTKAIKLKANFARAYYYRGDVHRVLSVFIEDGTNAEQSKADFKKAKELGFTDPKDE